MALLAAFGFAGLHGDDLGPKVDIGPVQRKQFTPTHAGVHGKEHHGGQGLGCGWAWVTRRLVRVIRMLGTDVGSMPRA